MTLSLFAKKLRRAADAIDSLFEVPGTPTIAAQIVKSFPNKLPGKRTYNGAHWTQKPENKKKVALLLRKANLTKRKLGMIK